MSEDSAFWPSSYEGFVCEVETAFSLGSFCLVSGLEQIKLSSSNLRLSVRRRRGFSLVKVEHSFRNRFDSENAVRFDEGSVAAETLPFSKDSPRRELTVRSG